MAIEDRDKWNKKYTQIENIDNTPIDLVKYYYTLANRGLALDIACGTGRHSIFLANQEFEVDALDISSVALENIQNIANIYPREVDFDNFKLTSNCYDLVVCTYFLDRNIIKDIYNSLAPNGVLIYETFVTHTKNEFKNSKFLLEKGELKELFSDLDIIFYEEWLDSKDSKINQKASLVAIKR
ncbi:tellurite resistance protein-related protein [hydrothermal vent metagenome]|uniref:Tellurite resistance protein-related protein n=1 Tax=hydrothermal vent metagenome TaxID=652676 RepID=A0A1W1ELB4_9ZZZZ